MRLIAPSHHDTPQVGFDCIQAILTIGAVTEAVAAATAATAADASCTRGVSAVR